nr:hypothetical protein [uncultured Flavobacterium sp.]
MEKRNHCHGGSLATMIAKQKDKGFWDLFGISEISGLVSADYKSKFFDFEI